ncbi:MAG: PLP-dependent transferase [Flavobacteriales bacterium]|nr:PLP-dependent transferase [Flavobacteriales bacterium]
MEVNKIKKFVAEVIANMPEDWLKLTTHRLDIYRENQAKREFLLEVEKFYENHQSDRDSLSDLPTAYDYIRLGHPLSCVFEWTLAKLNNLDPSQLIAFSSATMPIFAILRRNTMEGKNSLIAHFDELRFDIDLLRRVYGYQFETIEIENISEVPDFDGSVILVSERNDMESLSSGQGVDFYVTLNKYLGSVVVANDHDCIPEIQHVRRRESIAMTPQNCLIGLKKLIGQPFDFGIDANLDDEKELVRKVIRESTQTDSSTSLASSGLSIQYAITMGLIDQAMTQYPNKEIRFIVPTNCYGGTNDQARRVAASHSKVQVVDWHVDGEYDMVRSLDRVLANVADTNAVPLVIAEIPTNPRVEVPDLEELEKVLTKSRQTKDHQEAVKPVFILDQTFCPNVPFCSEANTLATCTVISYVSGSKFPSGGRCIAGYCVANSKGQHLIPFIESHLVLCNNEATRHQWAILSEQMPSMISRVHRAYRNTRDFVSFIEEILPDAKINFVSEELAAQGFTPSVFSLDLPAKGETPEAREEHKRGLNLTLINMMITEIPEESKHCVSYGQLKGVYWTVPATSTQGTTKEEDKDYIARVAVSPDVNLTKHQEVFTSFVEKYIKSVPA